MSATSVSERDIMEALHRVPLSRWGEVLAFLGRLQSPCPGAAPAPDVSALATTVWTAAALQQLPRDRQDAVLREQAARLLARYGTRPAPATPWVGWAPRELRKLAPEQRDILLEASAALAADEYATDPELTAFEALGQGDLHVDSSNTETR